MDEPSMRLEEEKLRKSIDHLKYELEMLKETSSELSTPSDLSREVGNALVESFVIHARGLIMFLYYSPNKEDDVMASDYFGAGEWAGIRDSIPQILETTLERANKEVAHITTFRIGRKLVEKEWDHPTITNEIFRIFRLFFDQAPDSFMPAGYMEWFDSHYKSFDQSEPQNGGATESARRST